MLTTTINDNEIALRDILLHFKLFRICIVALWFSLHVCVCVCFLISTFFLLVFFYFFPSFQSLYLFCICFSMQCTSWAFILCVSKFKHTANVFFCATETYIFCSEGDFFSLFCLFSLCKNGMGEFSEVRNLISKKLAWDMNTLAVHTIN